MFYKLDIEEPERVLNKLSRGQGGNINKKYFTTWVFSEHKVRATETVLPTTSIPSNRNSNNTDVASKTDTNVASKTNTNVASKSNPTIDIKTNTDDCCHTKYFGYMVLVSHILNIKWVWQEKLPM